MAGRPTYIVSCTASLCFRGRVTRPTEASGSLSVMPGWYMWQKCSACMQKNKTPMEMKSGH